MIELFGLSKRNSTAILLSLESQMDMGSSMSVGLTTLAQIETGESKKAIKKALYLIYDKNIEPSDALFSAKIINNVEKQMLDKTISVRDAIMEIIKLRDMSKGFEKTIFSIFIFPIIALPIGIAIDISLQPQFYEMYSSLIEQVKIIKGLDLSNDIKLMWYLMDRPLLFYILFGYIAFIVLLFSGYTYLLIRKPITLYRLIPLKAYDDIPLILFLIKSLRSSGLSTQKSLKVLAGEANFSIGMRQIYGKALYYVDNNKPLYLAFEQMGFPKEIMIWIKTSEMSGSLWEKADKIIDFTVKRSNQKLNLLSTILKNPLIIGGYLIIVYFIIGLFFSTFVLQRIANSLS